MTDTRYRPELAADILRCVSEGTPLRQVCREKGIAESTVRQWSRDDRDGFAARYEAARRMQVDAWADEIVLLSNRDDLEPNDKRVRIDTLKWLCSKLVPRRYGERLLVAGDAESPLQVMHRQVSLKELTDDQLDALERFAAHGPAGSAAMMRSPGPGGFLGLGGALRSLTMSPVDSALQQAHRQARAHLETGGTAPLASGKSKPTPAPAEEFVLPEDIDADEVLAAIHAKLGGAGKQRRRDEPNILERKAGGRIAVSGYHILRLGDGRYDLGKRYMQRVVNDIRARRIQLRTKALMRRQ